LLKLPESAQKCSLPFSQKTMIPQDLKYTKEHEWVTVKGDEAVVGLTDYAQSSLGDVIFVKLPETGKDVKQSQEVGCAESIKAVSNIYSPLSGKVTEVNKELEGSPELMNKSCYEQGWIYKLNGFVGAELDKLMSAREYEEYIKSLE